MAIDLETANPDYSSICEIGLANFEGHETTKSWQQIINPESYFDPFNVSIHGITEDSVRDAPSLSEVWPQVRELTRDRILVHYTHFDRSAIKRAVTKFSLPPLECRWLDVARVVRRTWDEFAVRGYGLQNVSETLGIDYRPHEALSDAWAAGMVLLKAIEKTGLSVNDWLDILPCHKSYVPQAKPKIKVLRSVGPQHDGPLSNEVVTFTGKLCVLREKAVEATLASGGKYSPSVTLKTTILVLGQQDLTHLQGHDKSNKHREAEHKISRGQPIRIIMENDFFEMIQDYATLLHPEE